MKIEIWSDVACPFCYIGKAHLDEALSSFAEAGEIEVVWKSYQLDPTLPYVAETDLYASLSEKKGMSPEQVRQMTTQVKQMAQKAGLTLDFDRAVPVNTMYAHILLQYAKTMSKGNEMKMRLLRAYFQEGENVASKETLIKLGAEIGLEAKAVQDALENEKYRAAVEKDVAEASAYGISGVPFFAVNDKYGISGAQPVEVFTKTIEKAYAEWKESNPGKKFETIEGAVCKPDGACD